MFKSMHKKCIILSLLLLIAGTAALKWSLAERKKEKHLRQQQQEILKSGLAKLDKMVAGQTDIHPSADIVFSENLQKELEKQRARKETIELVFTASTVCILTGGGFFAWWLLLCTARLLISFFPGLKNFFANTSCEPRGFHSPKPNVVNGTSQSKKENKKAVKAEAKNNHSAKGSKKEQKLSHRQKNRSCILRSGIADPAKYSPRQLEKQLKVLANSGWHSLNKDYISQQELPCTQTDFPVADTSQPQSRDSERNDANLDIHSAKSAAKIAVLLSDEESVRFEHSLKAAPQSPNIDTGAFNQLAQSGQQVGLEGFHEESEELEDLLKTKTEDLGKQMAELSEVAKTIRQSSLEHSEPLNNTLTQLTEQIAAIREYAGQQQDRVEKLQEGYDWNIIRTFCLRLIRCIDNVESRIDKLSKHNINTKDLEEIRYELIFALDSSGVEQFEPEINSDYRGQEKTAEAVKDKENTNNPKLKGKIAKVIRPGYRYIIDEANAKVVRTAQVKLFG